MKTDFNIALELNVNSFVQTKVSLSSFLEKNKSFNGIVYLLVSKESLVPKKMLLEISLIYKNTVTVSVLENDTISPLLTKLNENYKDRDLLVSNCLKLGVFLITGKVLYISHNSLFLKTISDFESNSELILTKVFNLDPSSMFYISDSFDRESTLIKIINELCETIEYVSKRKVDSAFLNNMKAMSKSTSFIPSEEVETSSVFLDKHFTKFKGKLETVSLLHFDDKVFNNPLYTKINKIWLQRARSITLTLSRPGLKNMKVPLEKLSIDKETIKIPTIDKHGELFHFKGTLAIFTTLNENYLEYAIVSFESFRLLNPNLNLDFFVFASNLSDAAKSKLEANNVTYIQLDLSKVFKIELNWPYPSECYWLFKGPDILYELGYSHSLYVDADVQCNAAMDLSWLNTIDLIAGAHRGKTVKQFIETIDNFPKISEIFKLDINKANSTVSINSGVLFFNNAAYVKLNIYEKAVGVFNKSKDNGFPRKGDDSLLCMLMAVYPDFSYKVLSFSWNDYRFYRSNRENHKYSILIHNFRQKPWNPIDKKFIRHKLVNKFVDDWLKIKKKLIADGRL